MSARPPASGGARAAFWLVLGVALLVRVGLAVEVVTRGTGMHDRPPLDTWLYHAEAEEVLDGDVFLRRAPALLAAQREEGVGAATYLVSPIGEPTFHRLYGREPLIHAPLYPWLLAPTLAASPDGDLMRLLQIFGSLLVAWGVFALARACGAKEGAAVAAMGLYALHPASLLYSAYLLKVTVIAGLLLALALTLAALARRSSVGSACALGLVLGLLHLSKGILLFAIPLVAFAAWRAKGTPRRRVALLAATALVFLLVVSPLLVRSRICGTGWLHNSSQAHLALIQFNFVGADGVHQVRPSPEYVHRILEGRSGTVEVLRAAVDTHPRASSFLFLLARKLQGFFNGYEPGNNLAPHLHLHLFDSLRWIPNSTWLLLPFAVVGLGGALRRWRRTWPALALLAVLLATCLAATSLARYRLPAVPVLCVLAALGLQRCWVQRANGKRLALHAVAWLALAVACSPARLAHDDPGRPAVADRYPRHEALAILAERYRGSQDLSPVLALEAIRSHPLSGEPVEVAARSPGFARYVVAHDWAYRLCMEADGREEARAVLENLLRFDPGSDMVRRRLRDLEK